MLSDEWLSRYGLLENFNASVTRTGTGTGTGTHTGTGTWTTGVTAIALCTSCSRAKNDNFNILLETLSVHVTTFNAYPNLCFRATNNINRYIPKHSSFAI